MNYDELCFTTFCVGNLSDRLKMSAKEIYSRLRRFGILNDYIIRHYDVLHTFSKEYITDELIDCMKEKGALE